MEFAVGEKVELNIDLTNYHIDFMKNSVHEIAEIVGPDMTRDYTRYKLKNYRIFNIHPCFLKKLSIKPITLKEFLEEV